MTFLQAKEPVFSQTIWIFDIKITYLFTELPKSTTGGW